MSDGRIGPVVSLRDLARVHGSGHGEVRALVGVSFDVAAGELVVEGVLLAELSRRELAKLRRTSIGYVFQDYYLVPALTGAENVALPLELDGIRAGRARKLAQSALEEVGLSGARADRRPGLADL